MSTTRLFTRRQALRVGAYGLGLGLGALRRPLTAWADAPRPSSTHPERILVVVELSGGNDGLNTVVPYGDDRYYQLRPTLGIPAKSLRTIDEHFGFHPALFGFERLYRAGKLAVVHGCGYDKPILSHFSSMGFWHTGIPHTGEKLGWLGRLADALDPQVNRNYLVNIATAQSLAVRSRYHSPLVFYDPESFSRTGVYQQQPVFQRLSQGRSTPNASLAFLNGLVENATHSAAFVRQAWAEYDSPVDYGARSAGLGLDLRKVAALINADMPARLYYVSYAGNVFDTHVHQLDLHARLLTYSADALRAFIEDLGRIGRGKDVTVMVFTEFGRRVPENASKGTDHGTATPVFVLGDSVRGGLYGSPPSLTELD
ncbi:MAG: DUF1501 domain-containing protein, partial [Desulfurellaceae bacterium]|nr:DUF1501 domain-containing protein [Desulfurellaceae bacterium]